MLDTVKFEQNNIILLRKNKLCIYDSKSSYVVLNFWSNLSLVLIKLLKNVCSLGRTEDYNN